MCGIAGIIQTDGRAVERSSIQQMAHSLSHRGPDGEGYQHFENVAIAHRRLSIIDLAEGAQPLANEDGRVWVTFNGEIYNYVELREQLRSSGHTFRTESDTEVIVHAYEQWGERCVDHFNGMFAFAILDTRKQQVFIARDRLGIKPLVYSVEPDRVAFASELQAIEQLDGINLTVSREAIDDYLQMQYIPAPRTIYKNVYKLAPGHAMTIGWDGTTAGPYPYWELKFEPDDEKTEQQWIEELDDLVRDAVRIRLRSDVPFGAFLSGGLDSSLVVRYMSELLDQPVETFSIGFEEAEFSELNYARNAANSCGTHHHEQIVRAEALTILPDLVRHYGEPFGDSSAVPTYYVCQMARQHVKMVLSGDGGDESFAGYSQHCRAAEHVPPSQPSLRFRTWQAMKRLSRQLHFTAPVRDPLEHWMACHQRFHPAEREKLWNSGIGFSGSPPSPIVAQYDSRQQRDYLGWFQYFDTKHYLPYDILTKVDIASMLHSLEVRVPLLDHRIVEFAARIPSRFKLEQREDKEWERKALLKKLARRYYDQEFIYRKKQGFAIPLNHWFQGETLDWVQDRLLGSNSRMLKLFDSTAITTHLERDSSQIYFARRIWYLLFLAEWFHQHPKANIVAS